MREAYKMPSPKDEGINTLQSLSRVYVGYLTFSLPIHQIQLF